MNIFAFLYFFTPVFYIIITNAAKWISPVRDNEVYCVILYCIVKRADGRRIDEMRVEVGLKESFKNNILVKSKLTWAGHVERIGDEK